MKNTTPILVKKDNLSTGIDFESGAAILIDKPAGITSFDVVYRVRRLLGVKKVGHAGTLDPAATGLLILLTGKGTRSQAQFMGLDKEYLATILLGTETTTCDMEGEIVSQLQVPEMEIAEFSELLDNRFKGLIDQIPPAFSAIKVNGVRSYKKARRGQPVELKARQVRIDEIEVIGYNWPEVELRMLVSSGFYVRSLAHDIGQIVGCGGTLKCLRRTRIGDCDISQSVTLDELAETLGNA